MIDELLPYYNQELQKLGKLAEEFAKTHPKVASQLHIGSNAQQDPHIGRLIQSFAFLTAHIQHALDDDYPQLCESLLNIIYPHYLAPIPSCSIVKFECQPELTTGYQIPRNTLLETTPQYNKSCQFTTVYPVKVAPLFVTQASISSLPLNAPTPIQSDKSQSVLRIIVTCASGEMTFAKLSQENLMFYINASPQEANLIYELIFNNLSSIALAKFPEDPEAIFLNKSAIRKVGFESEDGLLPYPSSSLMSYRLLTEFFAFPEKFMFFELTDLTETNLERIDNHLEIFLYFDTHLKTLEKSINAATFQLGCTPVVNLFSQIAEPIVIDGMATDYPVIPDARFSSEMEIYAIDKVTGVGKDKKFTYQPIYSSQHSRESNYFWQAKRKPKMSSEGNRCAATDIYLSLTDLNFNPAHENDIVVSVETKCTNGNLPNLLPFGGGEPYLQLSSAKAPLTSIQVLIPFTPHYNAKLDKGIAWKLISHLSLNYLSLADDNEGTKALKEILRLYNIKNLAETNKLIDAIIDINSRRLTVRSFNQFQEALCQGTEITVKFNEVDFSGSGLYFFSVILEHFFANYTTLNSFTKLIIKSTKKEGIIYQWSPRAGNKILL